MHVKDILDRKGTAVVTAPAGASLAEVAQLLAANNIGALVVATADGRVAGIFSERDLVRHIARAGAGVLTTPVAEHMTRAVVTSRHEDSIDAVMARMTRGRFRHVPVVGDDGRIAGIVSIGDVVKFHVEEVEHEAEALREYITHPPH